MTKDKPSGAAVSPVEAAPVDDVVVNEVVLEEFCARLSGTDKRVELIQGFYFEQKRDGKIKGTDAEYHASFQVFITKPV